mgnify:CR=1 FL=1
MPRTLSLPPGAIPIIAKTCRSKKATTFICPQNHIGILRSAWRAGYPDSTFTIFCLPRLQSFSGNLTLHLSTATIVLQLHSRAHIVAVCCCGSLLLHQGYCIGNPNCSILPNAQQNHWVTLQYRNSDARNNHHRVHSFEKIKGNHLYALDNGNEL